MITKKYSFSKETLETLKTLAKMITHKNIEVQSLNLLMGGLLQAEYQSIGIAPSRQGFKRTIKPSIEKNEIVVEDVPEIIVPGKN